MIYHETIRQEHADNTGTDWRCEITPLTAEESAAVGRNSSSVTYRAIIEPAVGDLAASARFTWRGRSYSAIGPSMCHTALGRIHHYEIFIGISAG